MPVTGVAATVGASAAPPVPARAHDILQGKFNQQRISFEGTLLDVFPDEIDPNFLFLTIQAGNEIIYAALREKLNDENALSSTDQRAAAHRRHLLPVEPGQPQAAGVFGRHQHGRRH